MIVRYTHLVFAVAAYATYKLVEKVAGHGFSLENLESRIKKLEQANG